MYGVISSLLPDHYTILEFRGGWVFLESLKIQDTLSHLKKKYRNALVMGEGAINAGSEYTGTVGASHCTSEALV